MNIKRGWWKYLLVALSLVVIIISYVIRPDLERESRGLRYPLFLMARENSVPLPFTSKLPPAQLVDIADPFRLTTKGPKPRRDGEAAGQKARDMDLSNYRLSAIIWDDAKPMAVINDDILSVGGRIGELEIKKILKDHVICAHDGRECILHLYEDQIKGKE